MYAICGSLSDVYKVLRVTNVVSWSIVIVRYKEHDNDEKVEVGSTLGNTLVDMDATCSRLEDAYKMFDNLFLKYIVSSNTTIGGYVDNGCNCKALEKDGIMLGLDGFGNALLTCMPM